MPSVAKLTEALFPDVCGELLSELNPSVPQALWRRTFIEHDWHQEDYFGQVLLNGTRPVGVLGMLFSERAVDGVARKFCNLHAWYVKPQYRALSLLLMRPALALKDHTLTDFSPSPGVAAINRRLGFATLDDAAMLLFPLPWSGPGKVEMIPLLCDVDAVNRYLSDAERRIFHNHRNNGCGHLLIRSGNESCYIVFSRIDGPRFSYCDVHYLSDRRVFARHHADVRSALRQLSGVQCVLVESRLLSGVRIPCTMRLATQEKMFRPAGVSAAQVDNLYSEIVSLKLSTLTGVRSQLRAKALELFRFAHSR